MKPLSLLQTPILVLLITIPSYQFSLAETVSPASSSQHQNQVSEEKSIKDLPIIGESFFRNIWTSTRISNTLKCFQYGQAISSVSLGLNVTCQQVVEPAWVRNYQILSDNYTISLNAGTALVPGIGLGAGITGQLTFARLIENQEKRLLFFPYLPHRFPWTAERAIKNLEAGDVVRLNLGFSESIGSGISGFTKKIADSAGVSVSKGSSLLTDIYRLKNNAVRVRFIANRTMGSFGASASISHISFFVSFMNIFTKWLNKFFSLNPFAASFSSNLSDDLPVQTYMTDYIFNLETTEGANAYNETISQILKMKYFSMLNLQLSDENISSKLLSLVQSAESAHEKSLSLSASQRPVIRIFKGQMETRFWSLALSTNARFTFNIWNNGYSNYHARSITRGWDADNNRLDLIYTTASQNPRVNIAQSIISKSESIGVDTTYSTKAASSEETPVPTGLSDLILYRNISKSEITANEISEQQKFFNFVAPTLASKINWGTFANGQTKKQAYLNMSLSIHESAMAKLPKLSKEQVFDRIRDLANRYSSISVVALQDPQNKEGLVYIDSVKKFGSSVAEILSSDDVLHKIELLEQLKSNEVFNSFGPAFFIGLIPETELEKHISIKINAGSGDGTSMEYKFGSHDVSSTYSSIQAMNATLNDRSFDLRIQIDNTGKVKAVKSAEECKDCDTLIQ